MSQGIVIANDEKLYALMNTTNTNEWEIVKKNIKNNYKKVILHLGSTVVFDKGGIYETSIAQNNLIAFSNFLKQEKIELYLWFLDSHGSDEFEGIYSNYKTVVISTIEKLDSLEIFYKGIAFDLEWINKPKAYNNLKLLEICKFVSENLHPSKKFFLFASLNENNIENVKRGYLVEYLYEYIDGFLGMVYPRDGGISFEETTKPFLDSKRIKSLAKFYKKINSQVVFSVESGLILFRNNNFYFIKTILFSDELKQFENSSKILHYKDKNIELNEIVMLENSKVVRNDGVEEVISKNDKLFYLEVNKNEILKKNYIYWEYFLIH